MKIVMDVRESMMTTTSAKNDCTGLVVFTFVKKYTVVLRCLADGATPETHDDYLRRYLVCFNLKLLSFDTMLSNGRQLRCGS
jgi:hypothetical protein